MHRGTEVARTTAGVMSYFCISLLSSLDEVQWQKKPFIASRLVLPRYGGPVSQWVDKNEAFSHIAQEIEKAIAYTKSKTKKSR